MFGKIWENKITQNKNEIIYDYKIFFNDFRNLRKPFYIIIF
jgi:hypothetical protein